jgi:peptide/nickel transport system permease protein
MLGHVAVRLAQALVVMLVMSVLVFVGVYAIGSPIDVLIGPDVSQELRLQTIAQYGLDRPLWEQYLTFLGRVLHGDFGRSFVFGMPVMDLILSRLPATLELTLAAVRRGADRHSRRIYAGYRPDSFASS